MLAVDRSATARIRIINLRGDREAGGKLYSERFRAMDDQHTQAAKSPTSPGREEIQLKGSPLSFWKRRPVMVVGSLVLAVLFFLGLDYLADSFTHESTDDAFLDATVVAVAPKVAGQVKKVYVASNQQVKKGDPLVEIDPRDFEVQLAQKKAAQDAAETNIRLLESGVALLGTQVATAEATAKQSEAEAAADQAIAEKANSDLKRAEGLIQNKTISSQEFDSAKAAAAAANATLRAGQEKAASNRAKIAEAQAQLQAGRKAWERAQAQSRQAGVDVDQADLNLSYTRITAPQDSHVTHKTIEEGDYVQVGQRFMALVADDIYAIANFKETQLRNIRPGQPVKIGVDSIGGRSFAGHVESIQAGSGAAFSLLPPENAVGNYVKVVQRVPVKILFDKPVEAGHVLGPGMSVVPSIQVTSFDVPYFVIAIAALMLALVAGFIWQRSANRQEPPAA